MEGDLFGQADAVADLKEDRRVRDTKRSVKPREERERPSLRRCWTQRCSRRLGCRPALPPPPAGRNQTASCCPDGTNTGPRWTEGTAAGQRTVRRHTAGQPGEERSDRLTLSRVT